ncbi:blue copper protein 1b-like [Aristolochia californica]|uniref:blue copper protein 1b-like n=1 Tax=Aristolochia californica TaxID=171875 RepID=UPI0035DA145B
MPVSAPYIPLFVSPEMQNWKRDLHFVEANHHTAASLMAQIKARVAFEALAALIIFPAFFASATEFIVGDDSGWSIDVDNEAWAEGKTLYVGDVLCTLSSNNGVLTSGSDRISLATPGNKWYICGVTNHCSYYSQKLKITVLPKDDYLPPSPSPAASEVSPAPAPWTGPVKNQPEKED